MRARAADLMAALHGASTPALSYTVSEVCTLDRASAAGTLDWEDSEAVGMEAEEGRTAISFRLRGSIGPADSWVT